MKFGFLFLFYGFYFFGPAESKSKLEIENILLGHKNPIVSCCVYTLNMTILSMFKEKFDCMTLEKSYSLVS